MSDAVFSATYHEARARFLDAAAELERRTGCAMTRHRLVVDPGEDLTVDLVEVTPPEPRRLWMVVTGLHGIEGYAGSAILTALMGNLAPRLDLQRTGLLLVHAVNPWGFQHFRRVNRANVDLNRNFEVAGEPLYGSDSSGYESLEHILNPEQPWSAGLGDKLAFFSQTFTALALRGMAPLRQATLSGQYSRPRGIFYGGDALQPESRFLAEHIERIAAAYDEILLTDLHTGYGQRGQAYPLFPQADSPEIRAYALQGVKTDKGGDKTYTARGELVRFTALTAKRLRPDGIFNGLILEMGTGGLGATDQLKDLETVVRENQVFHHGAATEEATAKARLRYRELFYPSDPAWQARIYEVVRARLVELLEKRAFLAR